MVASSLLSNVAVLGLMIGAPAHAVAARPKQQQPPSRGSTSTHTSNWAVVLSSSRYWFNFRHTINALSFYHVLREYGFKDDRIILMLADEYAVNARNPYVNQMLRKGESLYKATTEIDYRGEDVTAENVVRVLTGDTTNANNTRPVLESDRNSNILIYWTGHGGDQFFKFQDVEEIMAADIRSVFRLMFLRGLYREILFVADTCQAFTLGDKIDVPNVTWIGSSLRGESSYSHHSDSDLGQAIVERYTFALTERIRKHGSRALSETIQSGMVDPYPFDAQRAHIGVNDDHAVRKVTEARLSDFLVSVEWRQQRHQERRRQETPSASISTMLLRLSETETGNVSDSTVELTTTVSETVAQTPLERWMWREDDQTCLEEDVILDWAVEPTSLTFLGMISGFFLSLYALSRIV